MRLAPENGVPWTSLDLDKADTLEVHSPYLRYGKRTAAAIPGLVAPDPPGAISSGPNWCPPILEPTPQPWDLALSYSTSYGPRKGPPVWGGMTGGGGLGERGEKMLCPRKSRDKREGHTQFIHSGLGFLRLVIFSHSLALEPPFQKVTEKHK